MVTTVTSINGRLVERKDARISVFDNSLLYAEGLFETLLVIDDRLVFAGEHLRRLYRGARIIGLDIPVSPEKLTRWMIKTVQAHPDRITKLRLTVTSGEAARWVGRQGKPQIVLSASPHQMPTKPFRLHVSEFKVDQKSIFRRIKTISYAIHAAALKQARQKDCDDALLLNQNHQVAEVTSANLYWVRNGRVFTPPIGSGCLEGITRKIVLREARKLDHAITEKDASLNRLLDADEVFISSSLKLVVGVSHIRVGRRNHSFPSGPITGMFSEHFHRLVHLN
ncbi:MAG: aminotransferase class IV family protein [candidate division Zixibacteria bacterium]|nr:aminotransferase class IV family protein [candidate division Zixibacteria bacterium]